MKSLKTNRLTTTNQTLAYMTIINETNHEEWKKQLDMIVCTHEEDDDEDSDEPIGENNTERNTKCDA